jgi:hypothetical protein
MEKFPIHFWLVYYVCSLNENMYRFYLLFVTKNNLLQI